MMRGSRWMSMKPAGLEPGLTWQCRRRRFPVAQLPRGWPRLALMVAPGHGFQSGPEHPNSVRN
jgi:hypothetical protein